MQVNEPSEYKFRGLHQILATYFESHGGHYNKKKTEVDFYHCSRGSSI